MPNLSKQKEFIDKADRLSDSNNNRFSILMSKSFRSDLDSSTQLVEGTLVYIAIPPNILSNRNPIWNWLFGQLFYQPERIK